MTHSYHTGPKPEKPQGIFCCPGVRIEIEEDAVDQTETLLGGTCPACGRIWFVRIEESDD